MQALMLLMNDKDNDVYDDVLIQKRSHCSAKLNNLHFVWVHGNKDASSVCVDQTVIVA